MARTLSKLSQSLITAYANNQQQSVGNAISVNPVVSELATWYEKFRTAMDYRDDEVMLRSAIERILKRRLLLNRGGERIAPSLLRELVWARYFPDSTIGESTVTKVAHTIDLYLRFEDLLAGKHRINRTEISEWVIQLLSAEIEHILKPNSRKDLMCNFMFAIFRAKVVIEDDSEETRDIQTFIAVRRSFANDDQAFLRYHLFKQYFGNLTVHNSEKLADNFMHAYNKITEQLKYPLKDKILSYVKNQTVPFLILDDVLRENSLESLYIASDEDKLNVAILNACNSRYKAIQGKVHRAIVRSVIFIFFTKAIFALFVEGTFEKFLYGQILWSSIALNTLTPPILMVIVGVLIKTPSRDNSFKILKKIHTILFDEDPNLGAKLTIKKKPSRLSPLRASVFLLLWFLTFALSFGGVLFILGKFSVNPLSQAIFILFLAIVSFVSYRINKTANMYQLKEQKESIATLVFDFFFMPFIQVGRKLTQAVSQINIILFIFDFIIETPFKGIVAFFEQWLLFLQTQREKLE